MKIADGLQLGVTKPKLVYVLGSKLVVKAYLGGKQRVLRFFEGSDYDLAYRFADLIIRRFASLGVRKSKRVLGEDSYNLTLAQVQLDNDNENDVIQGLLKLHTALPEATPAARVSRANRLVAIESKLDLILAKLNA